MIPDVAEYQPYLYGSDWTGDGIPDLVTPIGNTIAIFAGLETLKKKSVIEREPSRTFKIGPSGTSPMPLERHEKWLVAYESDSSSLAVIDPRP